MAVFSSTQNTAACCGGRVEAEDVGRLGFKFRIVAGQVALQPVGLQARFVPDTMHGGVFADTQRSRQLAATPVRGAVAWFLAGGGTESGRAKLG